MSVVTAGFIGTQAVYFDPATPSVSAVVSAASGSIGIYFDRANPAVSANYGSGTFLIAFDRANPSVNPSVAYNSGVVGGTTQRAVLATDVGSSVRLMSNSGVDVGDVDILSIAAGDNNIGNVDIASGTLTNITNTVAIYFDRANPAVSANYGSGTYSVQFSPSVPSVKKDVASTGSYNSVQLLPMQRQIIAANSSRKSIALVHDSSNTVYIGLNSSITSGSIGNAFPIVSNQVISFDDYTGALFGALDVGDIKIKYIEI